MRLLGLIVLIVIVAGCKKTSLKGDNEYLAGDYTWEVSYKGSGIGNLNEVQFSPEESNSNYGIKILVNGKYIVYENDERLSTGVVLGVDIENDKTIIHLSKNFGDLVWNGVELRSYKFPYDEHTNVFFKK